MTALTRQIDVKNVDWTIAGAGDARDGNTSFELTGVTGTVKSAFLYWGELNFSGSSDTQITFNGDAVTGTRLGTSVDTCWSSDHSIGYFADVTSLVAEDGTFTVDGMGEGGQGASLVVLYDDGDHTNNRDLTFFAGNDSTDGPSFTTINLGQIEYESGEVGVTLNVGDGQSFTDGDLTVNGTSVGSNLFSGANGSLWDIYNFDLTPFLSVGTTSVQLVNESIDDCLQFISVIVDRPAKAPVLFLDFDNAIPKDFYIATGQFHALPLKEVVAVRDGSEPLGVFTDAQKASLVTLVQGIFDRSGIAMEVTQTQPEAGDYHSVRFSSANLSYDSNGDGTDNSRLLGQAYEGIDRFNTNDNNITAVFMDGTSDPLSSIALAAVHEGGHAFGARHVNPVQGSGNEVMDYSLSATEAFTKTVANITEPPVDGQAATTTTHNPAYHLRRYVLGESHEQLVREGIDPGAWDLSTFELITYTLGLGNLSESVTSLGILLPGRSDLVEGEVLEESATYVQVSDNIDGQSTVTFSMPEGDTFQIVGAGEDGVIDTVISFDRSSSTPFSMVADASQTGTLTGTAFTGETAETETAVATVSLAVEEVVTVSGEETLPALTVSVNRATMFEFGNDTATATITREGSTEGDLEVVFASNDTSEITVPNSVTILDGQASVEVEIQALDDFLADGTITTTLTALAQGYLNGVTTVDVLDNETPALILSVDPGSISEADGTATVTITRNTPPSGDLVVTLTSSDTTEATVQSEVTIPDGESSVTVTVTAIDDDVADGDQTVTVSAAATGFETGTSSVTVTDAASNSPVQGVPTITGTAAEDSVLTADTSGLSDANGLGTFSYQWLRDGTAISGATSATYTPGQSDVGSAITVQVSFTDGAGVAESATSAATSAVLNVNDLPAGSVQVTGSGIVGNTLTADASTLADEDGLGTLSYQWRRDGIAIQDAIAASYVLVSADIGATMSVSVSYTDAQGTDEVVLSANTVTAVPLPPTDGDDLIVGGPRADVLLGEAGNDTLRGQGDDDVLAGGEGDDSIDGGPGNDSISGAAGNDIENGGAGDDNMGGGPGNDTMNGGAGNDTMGGGQDDDVMDGGEGNDIVNGGPGNDQIQGGVGNDTMGASFGNDTVLGGDGDDSLGGGTGRDMLFGEDGNDDIGGGEGDDTVDGGAGNDFLAGGGRNDVIFGGEGDDSINGGAGNDTMYGDAGEDLFIFNQLVDGESDLILNFEDGLDQIRLTGVTGQGLRGRVEALNITDAQIDTGDGTEAGVTMGFNGHLISVTGVSASDFTVEDFIFLG